MKYLLILVCSAASVTFAARVGCWRLEAGAGSVATNTGTGANCDLRVVNDQGVNSAFWSAYVPSLNGENHSVWNSNIAGAWGVQSWTGYGNGVDDPNNLDFAASNSFTLMARVYMMDNGANDGIIGKYNGWGNAGYYIGFRESSGKHIVFYLDDSDDSANPRETLYGPDNSLSGNWVYVAAVRDRTGGTNVCRIYVDGDLKVSQANDVVGSLANGNRFRLGNLWTSAGGDSLCGYIAEAAVWNEALDSDSVAFYNDYTFDTDEPPAASSTNYFPLDRLAVYYGYPSLVNGAGGNLNAASNTFVQYDSVVFGAGLEEPGHGDHNNTATLIPRLTNSGCEVFGYIDLGVSTANYSYNTLTNKMAKWRDMGASGIFLDDYGYDYQVSRARQTSAVVYAHSIGCVVCANAWNPDDVLGTNYNVDYNPNRLACPLESNDVYLLESHQIQDGSYVSATAWTNKSSKCFAYKEQTGVRMFCLTSSNSTDDYSDKKWWYAFDSTVLYGFDAAAWGEPNYSSSGDLPWRSNHLLTIGNVFITNANNELPRNTAYTDEGRFWVDAGASAQTSVFQDVVAPRVSENVLIYPHNGADVVSGPTVQITWHSDAITDMFLKTWPVAFSLVNANYTNTLTAGTVNTGGWSWSVNAPTASGYRIELAASDTSGNTTKRYTTGTFTIREIPEPCAGALWLILFLTIPTQLRCSRRRTD